MANSKGKCSNCGKFFPSESLMRKGSLKFHSKDCLLEYATRNVKRLAKQGVKKSEKEARAKLQERKKALRPRSWYLKEAQVWFNRFIRLRDAGQACISCGRLTGAKINAGHYRSVGSCPELRYEELNCHLQCEHCNSYKSGNIEHYRPALIAKIGQEKVEWIEGPHKPKKYTIDDLNQIIVKYKAKCKELKSPS